MDRSSQLEQPLEAEALREIERSLHGRLKAHRLSDSFIERCGEEAIQRAWLDYLRARAEGAEIDNPGAFVANAAFCRAIDELRHESHEAQGVGIESLLASEGFAEAPAEEVAVEHLAAQELHEAMRDPARRGAPDPDPPLLRADERPASRRDALLQREHLPQAPTEGAQAPRPPARTPRPRARLRPGRRGRAGRLGLPGRRPRRGLRRRARAPGETGRRTPRRGGLAPRARTRPRRVPHGERHRGKARRARRRPGEGPRGLRRRCRRLRRRRSHRHRCGRQRRGELTMRRARPRARVEARAAPQPRPTTPAPEADTGQAPQTHGKQRPDDAAAGTRKSRRAQAPEARSRRAPGRSPGFGDRPRRGRSRLRTDHERRIRLRRAKR